MNKWRKRFKRQRRIAKTWIDWGDKKEAECNTALRKVAELRQDVLRAHTELARVQGVCEATQAQVLKHAATIKDLRWRETEINRLDEAACRPLADYYNALRARQRRVREAWERVFLASVTLEAQPTVTVCKDCWDALRQAIEAEPKEET